MKEFLKNTFPYFRKYMPVQALATAFGLMRMVILLVTPQVVSLLVDRVINPALGTAPQDNSSIFLFLIDGIPADDYWRIFAVLAVTLVAFAALFLRLLLSEMESGVLFWLEERKADAHRCAP